MSNRRYFGTDGVRGYVGQAPMTPDFLVRLGYATGKVLAEDKAREVLISKDTRLSGYMVESALEAGLAAAGVNVLLSGPLPTSAVSYLTPALRLSAGIVISASHNPHYDNGVKLFGGDGKKLPDAVEQRIEQELDNCTTIQFQGEPGRARRLDGGAERYIEFCKRAFPSTMNLRGLRVVVDCANGAAYHVAPPVFHELGAEVFAIGAQPDGMNINVECGALAPRAAIEAVAQHQADIAIILDGDADRILLADEKGRLHDGDALLYLIAQESQRTNTPLAGIVGTELSNLALEQNLQRLNLPFYRAAVGDRYVLEAMNERGWQVGGEPSGHIILRQFHHTGDGIIAALQALAAMRENQQPLSQLLANYQQVPQQSRNVAVAGHKEILKRPPIAAALTTIQKTLPQNMRLIVRPSGTEALVRIMVEGHEEEKIEQVMTQVEQIILKG